MKLAWMLALSLLCCMSTFALETVTDSATGQVFPASVSFSYGGKDYQLQVTGVSTRKKLFVKVYSIAHYLQNAADTQGDKIKSILDSNLAKQFTLKWDREVPSDRVMDGYRESFQKALSNSEHAQLRNQIEAFVN